MALGIASVSIVRSPKIDQGTPLSHICRGARLVLYILPDLSFEGETQIKLGKVDHRLPGPTQLTEQYKGAQSKKNMSCGIARHFQFGK